MTMTMTGNRIARVLLAVLFVGLILTPLAIKRISARRGLNASSRDAATALARHGFYLQEVSRAAGINFVHQAPVLDPKLEPIMPEVASMAPRCRSSISIATAGPTSTS